MQMSWNRPNFGRSAGVVALGFALTLGAGLASVEDGPAPTDNVPFYACFAQGTPDSVVQWWYEHGAIKPGFPLEVPDGQGGYEYFTGSSWSGTGAPDSLTWSFVPDGLFISSIGTSSSLFSAFDAEFGGDRAQWILRFDASFERFETLSGLTMTRVTSGGNDWDNGGSWGSGANGGRGDIRIAGGPIDGPSNTLAFAMFPTNGDMVFDTAENWDGAQSDRLLRNTIFHEASHSLGIDHVCPINGTKLMEPFINLSFVGPEHDDLRALHRQHGDPWENNNSSGAAHDFGPVAASETITPCDIPGVANSVPDQSSLCSIDTNSENDYYEIQVTSGDRLSVTVTPIGRVYSDNTQSFSGSCNTGNTTNSIEQANLALQILASNGSTVLATSSAAALGDPESITDLAVTPGTYFVRVYETASVIKVQMYDLDITVTDSNPGTGEFNDLGFGLAGATAPVLSGTGDLTPGSGVGYSTTVSNGIPFNQAFLFISLTQGNVPFKLGTLVPWPINASASFPLNGSGSATLPHAIDISTPNGLAVYVQYWFADAGAPAGASASNGLELVIP